MTRKRLRAAEFSVHAYAVSALTGGDQLSTASSVMCSRRLSIESAARLVIAWKIFAVMTPLICKTVV